MMMTRTHSKRLIGLLSSAALLCLLVATASADVRVVKPRYSQAGPRVQWKVTNSSRMVLSVPRSEIQRGLRATGGLGGARSDAGPTSDGPQLGAMETVVVGLALSGAIALFGLWLVRRRKQSPADAARSAPQRARGGVLLLLVFGAGLAITLLSVSDAQSDLRVKSRVRTFDVVRSKARTLDVRAPARAVCPLAKPPRPRPKG